MASSFVAPVGVTFGRKIVGAKISLWCNVCTVSSPLFSVAFLTSARESHRSLTPNTTAPQVVILMLRRSDVEVVDAVVTAEAMRDSGSLENAYVAAFVEPDLGSEQVTGSEFPRKALLNAVGDLCQTR